MARINLLPWREEQRKQRKRDFFVFAGIAAFTMVVVVVVLHFIFVGLIENQDARNAYMQTEIKKVEAQIKEIQELEKKKQQLIDRMKVIDQLQKNRPEVVHMFDELVRVVPEGMYLTSVVQKDKTLTIEGRAQSNARVSALMRALDASAWFTNPQLEIIQSSSTKGDDTQTFKMHVQQKGPEQEDAKSAETKQQPVKGGAK